MKLQRHLVVLGLATGAAMAQTTQNYPDTTGEVAVGTFPHLDIASVDVTLNEAETEITFRINLAGDPVATNWGKYMIGIRSNPGGATTGNGWGRPIHMAGGMTHWIGAWVDDGGSPTNSGGGVWSHGTGWSTGDAPGVSRDATGVTIVTTPAALGLSPGETFSFDVYSSGGGGGDSAVDALSAAAASITGWGGPFTTGAVGAETNPARSFTMPGTADFSTWIAGFALVDDDALPGTDYDDDGLTNQQEFDLDIGLDPTLDDCDFDGLKDGEESLTGVFVDASDTGSNPMVQDSDGDSVPDGDEAKGEGPSGDIQNPNHFNHAKMVVPGSFNLPGAWDANGFSDPSNEMTRAGTGLAEQYQWSLDYRFAAPKVQIAQKFAAGAWTRNWGASGTAGVAVASGGDINRSIAASGIHRFTFDTVTLAHNFTRPTFADAAAFLAAYGLAAGEDEDGDNLDNEAEFAANTDPYNADTDGDGLNDDVDPEPLVAAPESREVLFQVNMTVATTSGYFTPGTSTVRVIGQFAGWSTTGGVVLEDPDQDGIYTGPYQAAGFEGVPFGTYKFFIDGGPDGGYEQGADRNFNLGPDGVQQVLPVTYFSYLGPPTGFDVWITGFEGLSDTTRGGDPDGDGATNGDEFLFGTSPASGAERPVTATRTGAGLLLTWLERESGATYVLQENPDLAGEWETSAIVPADAVDQSGVPADYDRMEALLPLGSGSNFLRVNAMEN